MHANTIPDQVRDILYERHEPIGTVQQHSTDKCHRRRPLSHVCQLIINLPIQERSLLTRQLGL